VEICSAETLTRDFSNGLLAQRLIRAFPRAYTKSQKRTHAYGALPSKTIPGASRSSKNASLSKPYPPGFRLLLDTSAPLEQELTVRSHCRQQYRFGTSRLLGAFRHLIRLPTREHSAFRILAEERQLSDGVTVTAMSNSSCTRPAKCPPKPARPNPDELPITHRRTGKFSRIRLKPHDTIGVVKSSSSTY
jgi:hypothetical protein